MLKSLSCYSNFDGYEGVKSTEFSGIGFGYYRGKGTNSAHSWEYYGGFEAYTSDLATDFLMQYSMVKNLRFEINVIKEIIFEKQRVFE